MFSFFSGKSSNSNPLYGLTSILKNDTPDDSSVDSRPRRAKKDRRDDESSLASSYRDIDVKSDFMSSYDVMSDETTRDGELRVDSTVSAENQCDKSQPLSPSMSRRELQRLVGMPEMPSYKIRRKIATKVMSKKVSKGYVILDELCEICDMPLMEGRGRKDCRVCPSIEKWMEAHNPRIDANPSSPREDWANRIIVHDGNPPVDEENQEILSDAEAAPEETSFMTPGMLKRIKDLTTASPSSVEGDLAGSEPDGEREVSIEDRAKKIIMEVRKKSSEESNDRELNTATEVLSLKSAGDNMPMSTKEGTGSVVSMTSSKKNIEEESAISVEERAKQIIMEVRKKESMESAERKAQELKESEESAKVAAERQLESAAKKIIEENNAISVEDRAKQIIMEVRSKGGWNEKDPAGNEIDEAAYFQGVAEARAALIINRARASLGTPTQQRINDVGSEDEDRFFPVAPDLIAMKAKESLQEVTLKPTTPRVKTQHHPVSKIRSPLNYKASASKMTYAATIIQSFARMVLARLAFVEHQSQERTKLYRELLAGNWQAGQSDRGDPEGDVPQRAEYMYIGNEAGAKDPLTAMQIISEPHGGVNDVNTDRNTIPNAVPQDPVEIYRQEPDWRLDEQNLNNGTAMVFDATVVNDGEVVPEADLTTYHENSQHPTATPIMEAEVMHAADVDHYANPTDDPPGMEMGVNTSGPKQVQNRPEPLTILVNEPLTTEGVIVRGNDPPATPAALKKPKQTQKNMFSKLVTKVKDTFTCSGGEQIIGCGISDYQSAPVSVPSDDGTYFDESKRNAASYRIMYRATLGWKMSNHSCMQCQMPMMIRPDDNDLMCVICDELGDTDNITMGPHSPGKRAQPIDPEPVNTSKSRSNARSPKTAPKQQMSSTVKTPLEPHDRLAADAPEKKSVVFQRQRAATVDRSTTSEPRDATTHLRKNVPTHQRQMPANSANSRSTEPRGATNAAPLRTNVPTQQRQMPATGDHSRYSEPRGATNVAPLKTNVTSHQRHTSANSAEPSFLYNKQPLQTNSIHNSQMSTNSAYSRPIEPSALASLPTFQATNYLHQVQTPTNSVYSKHSGTSVLSALPTFQANNHQRQMAANSASSRAAVPQSNITPQQWMVANQTYNTAPAQTNNWNAYPNTGLKSSMSVYLEEENSGHKNPFSLAHQQLFSPRGSEVTHHSVRSMPSRQQNLGGYSTYAPQLSAAPRTFGQSSSSFIRNQYVSQTSQGVHTIEPLPTPNYSRNCEPGQKIDYIGVKENSFGDANLSHQQQQPLAAAEEAKLRMSNAQSAMRKKILYYN